MHFNNKSLCDYLIEWQHRYIKYVLGDSAGLENMDYNYVAI